MLIMIAMMDLFLSQWKAEIWYFINVDVHVDVEDVLVDVHGDVRVGLVDAHHDGYDG